MHRQAVDTFDESADLTALSRTSLVVVCAGVKSILDVPATLERLESLSVTVVGYRTTTFPGLLRRRLGFDARLVGRDPAAGRRDLRRPPSAAHRAPSIVANPLPLDEQLDPALHDRVIAGALAAAEQAGVRGKDVTPFVLDHLHRASEGATLAVNVRLVLRNAELAGADRRRPRRGGPLSSDPRVVVVGDVATDVVAVLSGEPRPRLGPAGRHLQPRWWRGRQRRGAPGAGWACPSSWPAASGTTLRGRPSSRS